MSKIIAVIGAGTMGAGIAQTAAACGHSVKLIDSQAAALQRARTAIETSMQRLLKKTVVDAAEAERISKRILISTDLIYAADATVTIEAITENESAKLQTWTHLSEICSEKTLFASNTSSISITLLANSVTAPERFIGMHFFNPVPVMKLVELVRGNRTSDESMQAARELAAEMGKTPVEARDFPGFVANRVLMPMINEAIFTVYEGVATPGAVDDIMKLGMAHPMGPLALADFIGLDVCLAVMEVLHRGFGDSKYRACPLLKQMVAAGKLGKKSGEGFFKYA